MTDTNNTIHTINPRSRGKLNSKVYIKYSENINLGKEANELKRCTDLSLHTRHIFTPELISYDQDMNLLSIKRIYGSELFESIWNPTSLLGVLRGKRFDNLNILSSRIVELGNWLFSYHESSSKLEPNAEAANWLQDSFLSKLRMTRDKNLLSLAKVNKIENHFVREISNLKSTSYLVENNIKICQLHGDFIIYNVLIDKEMNLHVLDFADTRIGFNTEDIARFYSNFWAIAQTNNWRKSVFEQVSKDFLLAYGVVPEIIEMPCFKALMAYNFVNYLNSRFIMVGNQTFISNLETGQLNKAGINWINQKIS